MKLRVKLDFEASAVHRVDVPPSATLQDLQALVVQCVPALATTDPTGLVLSLNKKDALSGGAVSMQQLGLCGGDTVWVLTNGMQGVVAGAAAPAVAPAGSTPTSAPAGSSAAASAEGLSGVSHSLKKARPNVQPLTPAAAAGAAAAARAAAAAAAASAAATAVAEGTAAAAAATSAGLPDSAAAAGTFSGPGPMDVATLSGAAPSDPGASAAAPAEEGRPDAEDVPLEQLQETNGLQIPPALRRVLLGKGAEAVTASSGLSPHALLLAAVHATMLETGFVPQQQASIKLGQAPRGWSATYGWRSDEAAAAADSSSAQQQQRPGTSDSASAGSAACEPSCTLRPCRVTATALGPFLTVHAALLSVAAPAAPAAAGPGAGAGAIAAAPPAATQTLHLDTRLLVGAAPAASAGVAAAGAGAAGADAGAGPSSSGAAAAGPSLNGLPFIASLYLRLPELWLKLKDQVALWLLSRCFQEAGLPTPVGLLMLPMEIKLQILDLLKAKDLAAVSGTCSELQHLASSDPLWSALFRSEFTSVTPEDAANASRGGWKAAFAARWRQRAAAEAARRRVRLLLPRDPRGFVPPPPFGPYPAPPPFLPGGGVVGGDYDRLPMPLLGQGPGMFPPRFGFGGGVGGGAMGGPAGPLQSGPFGGGGRGQQPPFRGGNGLDPFGGMAGPRRGGRGTGTGANFFM